jgi:hypothetical protein
MNEAQRTLLLGLVHTCYPPSKAETLSPGTIAQLTHLQLALYEKLLLQLPIGGALGHVGAGVQAAVGAGVQAADRAPAVAYMAKCSEKARNQRGYERRKARAATRARKGVTPAAQRVTPAAQSALPAKGVTPSPAKGVPPPPAKGVTPLPAKGGTPPPAKGVTPPPAKGVTPPAASRGREMMRLVAPVETRRTPEPGSVAHVETESAPDVPPRWAAPAVPQRRVNGRLIPLSALGSRDPRVQRTGPVIRQGGVYPPPQSPSVARLRTLAQQAVSTTTDMPSQPQRTAPAVPQKHVNGRLIPLSALGSRGLRVERTGPVIRQGGVYPPPQSPPVAGLRTLAQQAVSTTTDKPPQPQRTPPAVPQRHDIGIPLAEKAAAPAPVPFESPPPDLVHPAARRWQSGPLKPFVGFREIDEIPCRTCGRVFDVLRGRVYLASGEPKWLDKTYWSLCPACEEQEDAFYAESRPFSRQRWREKQPRLVGRY